MFILIAPRLVDQLPAMLADAVGTRFIALDADARRLVALGADQHHVGDVDWAFELDATRVDLASSLGLYLALVLGANIDTLHHDAAVVGHHVDDLTALALVFEPATDDLHGIAFVDLYSHCITPV